MEEFLILVVCIVLFLIWVHYRHRYGDPEGFADAAAAATSAATSADTMVYHLKGCPAGMKLFYDSTGTSMCCEGDIVAGHCVTEKQCALSGGTEATQCATMIRKEYMEKARTVCPASMPTYYETVEGDQVVKKACTDGPLNGSLSGPRLPSQTECVVYSSMEENQVNPNSCYLQRQLDAVTCFGQDCTKQIISTGGKKPALVAVSFTDPSGLRHTAYTKESMEAYLNATKPQWRETGLDLSKNLSVAEVAKAFYVEKTLSKQDLQM